MKYLILLLIIYVNSEPLYFYPKHDEISCQDSKSTCPANSTCCPMPTGDYGCCNSPKAVCCLDKRHCCPEGTICDLVTSSCTNSTNSEIRPSINNIQIIGSVECPDQSFCLDGQTCCQMSTGKYGCCPLENAVCCNDHMHCCPTGTTCDVPHKTCKRGQMSIPWMKKLNSQIKPLDDVMCPDQVEHCEDGQTCCQLSSGGYGCCPFQNAVCCSDKEHCCPMGMTCDLTTLSCRTKTSLVRYLHSRNSDETCPDKLSFCEDNQTCCLMHSGLYGCCPFTEGVCCSDMLHCCPEGKICDVDKGMCNSQNYGVKGNIFTPINWVAKPLVKKKLRTVTCPDQSMCDDDQTCCQISSGEYACCPIPNAVCCSDRLHCCPEETTCDLEHDTCMSNGKIIPWASKVSSKISPGIPNNLSSNIVIDVYSKASKQDEKLMTVTCPDQSMCYDDQTCCVISSGGYACCPIPNAVCCSDMLHCCPEETTCDLEHDTCNSNGEMIPWASKVSSKISPGIPKKLSSNVVIDVFSKATKEAVCCEDGIHCCKHGQCCDTVHMRCVGTNILEQKPLTNLKNLNIVQCDTLHYCNEGERCCPNDSGFSCCPFSNGKCCAGNTCCQHMCFFFHMCLPSTNKPVSTSRAHKIEICSDGLHFCESGFECDLTIGTCVRTQLVFDYWSIIENENPSIVGLNDTIQSFICEDTNVECQTNQKCCKNGQGGLGCCPFQNGICCESGYGCCPEGTKCSFDGRCRNPNNSISLSPTILSHAIIRTSKNYKTLVDIPAPVNEQCSDKSFCPKDTTCCIQMDGQFGCCQYPNAMCCEDKIHCCPSGYQCDVAHQQCKEKGIGALPFPWLIFTRNKAKFLP